MTASLPLPTLLLGCVLAWPVYGQSLPADQTRSGLGVSPPDLPASVTISPSDLQPGEGAHSALSRLVADPGRILQAYAPVGRQRTAATGLTKPTIFVRPAVLAPLVPVSAEPQEAVGDPPPGVNAASPAATIASVPAAEPSPPPAMAAPKPVSPPGETRPGPVVEAPAASSQESAPPAAASIPSLTLPASSSEPAPAAAVAVLDAATLQKAIDAYVGPEPVPVGGRIPAPDQARYKDRQSLRDVYAARNFAPLWIENGAFNAKARSVKARIDHAAEDGLDLHSIGQTIAKDNEAAGLAQAELAMSEAAVAYGRQASGGRVDPGRIGALIAARPEVADPARVLALMIEAEDAGEALHALNPPQKGYTLLRSKLAELRQESDVATRTTIPYGPALKPGMRDARVPLIRARFGLDMPSADVDAAGLVYDTEVAEAVADFQKAHHLPASGILTIRTVAALSGGDPRRLEDEIIANMERWRWVPRDMGENHIEVNIPDFTVSVMHGDEVFHRTRVVVGQPDKPTPVFSETMQFIIVNPYWNVPLSIVKKEMLPKLAADPDYFANHGYETVERDGQTYVRQPPGDSNALGRIKFMFPNPYSVYLHDTNARSLFGNERRALSHGCVRVEAPFKFAEAVLGKENGWTEARVKKLIGGNERTINLPHPLPIHIVYFTAFVDDSGTLQLRDDVYGYSAKLKAALGLGEPGQVAVN